MHLYHLAMYYYLRPMVCQSSSYGWASIQGISTAQSFAGWASSMLYHLYYQL